MKVEDYLRDKDRLRWGSLVVRDLGYLALSIVLDIPRLIFLVFCRLSGRGRKVLIASNRNQIRQVEHFIAARVDDYRVVWVKRHRAIATIPHSGIFLSSLWTLLVRTRKTGRFSHIDHDNIRYRQATPQFTVFFRLLGVQRIVLSAEMSNSYRSAIRAAVRLDVPVLICEHGSVVRRTDDCVNADNIHCAFTSAFNLSMRHPPPRNPIKIVSPLIGLYREVQSVPLPAQPPGVLVADTLSIRDRLADIVASLKGPEIGAGTGVRVRAHPGRQLDPALPLDTPGKPEALRAAGVVVSGISGFVVEALFCGIPAVVLVTGKDAWAQSVVSLYRECPYCIEVSDIDQISDACAKQLKRQPHPEEVEKFQDLVGFRKEENVENLSLF